MKTLSFAFTITLIGLHGFLIWDELPSLGTQLFVSLDLYVITLLTATPLALWSARLIEPFPALRIGVAGGCSLVLVGLLLPLQGHVFAEFSALPLLVMRFVAGTAVTFLLSPVLLTLLPGTQATLPQREHWLGLLGALAIGGVSVGTYQLFLERFYEKQLAESMEQGRVEQARLISSRWCRLTPVAHWNEQPVRQLQRQLSEHCAQLRYDLSQASKPQSLSQRGLLIQAYLSLDEWESARQLLRPLLQGNEESPLAWDTLGLIAQREQQWASSLQAYERASLLWQQEKPVSVEEEDSTSQQRSGLESAYRGMAYAHQKMGQLREADLLYQQLIQFAPSADNHFLLAQFYEDAQQTEQAEHHAHQAAGLAPLQYKQSAHQLLEQMKSAHFGCLRVR